MIGLPIATEIQKQLPKTRIFDKMDIPSSMRKTFDDDVSRINIVNMLTLKTIPGLQEGEEIKSVYVLQVILKREKYDKKSILLLSKKIPQNIVLILQFKEKVQLAIFQDILHTTMWKDAKEWNLRIEGNTLLEVWENIVRQISGISLEEGKELNRQIEESEEMRKLMAKIDTLEKKIFAEKQSRRKMELFEEMLGLKKQLKER